MIFVFIFISCGKNDVIATLDVGQVTYITPTTAVINSSVYEIGPGVNAWNVGVCVSTQSDPGNGGEIFNGGINPYPGMNYKTGLSGLKPNTRYYVCAFVETEEATIYSDTISFKTENINTFTDNRDGQKYMMKQIGLDTWMIENLNYYTNNSVYFQNDSSEYAKTFGRLYLYNEAEQVCPQGWHLPTREEWTNLVNFVANDNEAGIAMKVPGTKLWNDDSNNEMTNESWFSVVPSGSANNENSSPEFSEVGDKAIFWAQSEDQEWSYGRMFSSINGEAAEIQTRINNSDLFSVRCVKDKE